MRIPPWAIFVLVAGAAGLFASCGKKGPPILPEHQMTLKVEALSAETKDGILFLEGRVVSKAEEGGPESAEAAGCKIDHGVYPLDSPPCEGCPIRFVATHQVEGEVVRDESFQCRARVPLMAGIHYFRVRLTGPRGETGPPSPTAKVVIETEEKTAM